MPLAITAEDFDYSHTTVRYGWTVGKMRHVIAALDGSEVAIVVDKHDGYTVMGRLMDTFADEDNHEPHLTVESGPVYGCAERFTYRLVEVGVIMEMSEDAEAKWVAVDGYRAETERAIEHARAQHPDSDHGTWTGVPHDDCVLVTYQPSSVTEEIPLFALGAGEHDDRAQ